MTASRSSSSHRARRPACSTAGMPGRRRRSHTPIRAADDVDPMAQAGPPGHRLLPAEPRARRLERQWHGGLLGRCRMLLALRRRGRSAVADAEFPTMRLVRLAQTYRRIGRERYAYEAASVGYAAVLEARPSGVVVDYPGLFEC